MSKDRYGERPPDPIVEGGGGDGSWADDRPVTGRPASVVKRTAAFLLDFLALFVILVIVLTLAGLADGVLDASTATTLAGDASLVSTIVTVLGVLAYFVALEGVTGQTLAKRALGIKVVMDDGSPATLAAAFMRRLPLVVAMLIPRLRTIAVFGVELAMLITALRDERAHRGFHDVWAGTKVIDV